MNAEHTLWEYRLQAEDSGQKYLTILRHKFHFSLRILQRLKQGEQVWINGKFTYLTARGKEGEMLSIQLFHDEKTSILGEKSPPRYSLRRRIPFSSEQTCESSGSSDTPLSHKHLRKCRRRLLGTQGRTPSLSSNSPD